MQLTYTLGVGGFKLSFGKGGCGGLGGRGGGLSPCIPVVIPFLPKTATKALRILKLKHKAIEMYTILVLVYFKTSEKFLLTCTGTNKNITEQK